MAIFFASASTTPAHAFGKKKKAEPVVVTPPPEQEVPLGAPVLSGHVIDQASAYVTFMRSASAIGATFHDGSSVSSALKIGVNSEQRRLQQGMVAYAAIVALQDPTFTATVREWGKLPSRREAMIRYILADPNYVTTLKGHENAAGLVIAALTAQGTQLKTAGDAVKQTAYDIQLKAAWSKKAVPNPHIRLQEAKQLSVTGMAPAIDVREQLALASTGSAPLAITGAPLRAPYNATVIRGLAVAALAVLGKAGEEDMAYIAPLLANDADTLCFNMAKLNLYQCLSVARPYYEDVYCLGLHALGDTGQCVLRSVGKGEPMLPAVPTVATLIPASAVVASGSAAGRAQGTP